MALAFKVLSGALQDKVYKISAGLTVGRQKADLNLEDRKVSGLHASVQENVGKLHLVDLDSRNGLLVGEERVDSVLLEPGVIVRVGNTSLEVIELDEAAFQQAADPMETWRSILFKFNQRVIQDVEFPPIPVGPIVPALRLDFVQGRQLDTRWTVGYGPRKFGFFSGEFRIDEPGAPDICFEVFPNEGAWFKTDHPERVLLNGQSLAAEKLNAGDRISIGDTVIQVSFLKE